MLALAMEHAEIQKYALGVLNHGKRKGAKVLGINWVHNFLDHHFDELSTHWSAPLEDCRAKALTPNCVAKHFQWVLETQTKYNIDEDIDFGMDETNIMLGRGGKKCVVSWSKTKQQWAKEDGNRESVSVVETICADGTVLKPTVIYSGKSFSKQLMENNPCGAQ
jgi:hypothetical protein